MSFEDDLLEPEAHVIKEGRRRVRSVAPAVTDEQFQQWLADVRRRGGRLELVPDGVIAHYDRGPR